MLLGKPPGAPAEMSGNTPLTIANAGGVPMCMVLVFETNPNTVQNWLGTGHKLEVLMPGTSRTFMVKPGAYHIDGAFCRGTDPTGVIAGTYGPNQTANIDGPTLVQLGPDKVAPPPGAKVLAFRMFTGASAGGGGGEASEAPAAAEEPPASEPASSSSSSSESSAPPAKTASCSSSGGTCGFENDYPCCSGTVCSQIDKNGHGTCR
jgi:hypothetical protein